MAAKPLAPRALYQEVAESLRQRIYTRDLAPGDWIDELAIAKDYGISRTPLREALKVLAAEGLVTMKVRRGAYVTEVSDKDLNDVYHLMALLEADAAAVVAQNATPKELQDLLALHHQLVDAAATSQSGQGDTTLFFQINERFHVQLLAIANNRWRDQLVADLRKVMKLNRQNSLLKMGRVAEALAEHQAIVDALVRGDGAAAAQAMHAHFAAGLLAAQSP